MHLFEHCLVAHVMCGNYWIEYSAFSHPHTQTHILPTSNIEMNFPRHFRVISIFVEMGIFAWKQLKSFRLLVILIPKRNAWPFKVANNHYANFWRTIPHTEMWNVNLWIQQFCYSHRKISVYTEQHDPEESTSMYERRQRCVRYGRICVAYGHSIVCNHRFRWYCYLHFTVSAVFFRWLTFYSPSSHILTGTCPREWENEENDNIHCCCCCFLVSRTNKYRFEIETTVLSQFSYYGRGARIWQTMFFFLCGNCNNKRVHR